MRLLEPYFLYAFLALAIPIIIHLFSLRKHKTVYFSNVAFLKQIQEKKTHINQIQKRLLLLVRLSALSAIILAFCEPYTHEGEALKKEQKIIGIYLDNSFSMEAENEKGILMEQAKNKARTILNAHKGKDEFIFISNDLQGKHQRLLDAKNCLLAIDETQITASVLNLESILNRWDALKQNEINASAELYLISDFQKANFPIELFTTDSSFTTHLLPIESYPQSNLTLDSCYFESPNHHLDQNEVLNFYVSNASDKDLDNLSVKLTLNGKSKALTTLSVKAFETAKGSVNFRNQVSGNQKGHLELVDASIPFDNRLYFNYKVVPSSKVMTVFENTSSKALKTVFREEIFDYTASEVGKLNLNTIKNQDLLILEHIENPTSGLVNTLKSYVKLGGALFIIPPVELNTSSYQRLSEELEIASFGEINRQELKVSTINRQHSLFKEVFEKQTKSYEVPKVNLHYQLETNGRTEEERVMTLNSQEAFIASYALGQGIIYLLSSPLKLSSNNFENHALFVPLLYNMALQKSTASPIYYTLGKSHSIDINTPQDNKPWRIQKKPDLDLIAEVNRTPQKTQLKFQNTLHEDGFYKLSNEDAEQVISFNYDRDESEMELWEHQLLAELTENHPQLKLWKKEGLVLEENLKAYRSGFSLWQRFIFLALILLIVESLLLKNWKKKAVKLDNEDL